MGKLVNLVHVTVAAGYLERIKPAMLANARHSVQEAGCHQFDVVVSNDDDHKFVFYEVYDDQAALDAHRQTDHFKTYWKILEELGDNLQRQVQLYSVED